MEEFYAFSISSIVTWESEIDDSKRMLSNRKNLGFGSNSTVSVMLVERR